jgi:hypothetical protein
LQVEKNLQKRLLASNLTRLVSGRHCQFFFAFHEHFYLDFIKSFCLLVFLQLIKSEVRGKAVEVQEVSFEEDDDANDEENGFGTKSSGGGNSSSDDGQDDGEEASSDRETSSPKVDVVG